MIGSQTAFSCARWVICGLVGEVAPLVIDVRADWIVGNGAEAGLGVGLPPILRRSSARDGDQSQRDGKSKTTKPTSSHHCFTPEAQQRNAVGASQPI